MWTKQEKKRDSSGLRNSKVDQYNQVKNIKSDELNKEVAELLMKNNKTKPETRLIDYLKGRLKDL